MLDYIKYQYISYDETEFFRQCLDPQKIEFQCSMDSYLKNIFIESINNNYNNINNTKLLLFEKTSSYIRTFHSSYFLSYFSYIYNMYFYVIIRNPLKRIFSQIYHDWMFLEGYETNPDLEYVSKYIMSSINNFGNVYPLFNNILNELKITNLTNNNNDDLNIAKIIKLYEYGFYKYWNKSSDKMPALFLSCYLPQIFVWKNAWNNIPIHFNLNIKKTIKFEDRFKIILSEDLFLNPIDKAIKLISWITNTNNIKYQYDKFKLNFKTLESKFDIKKHQNIRGYYAGQKRNTAPKNIDPFQLDFASELNSFYNDSYQRLLWFLRDNPELLL